MFTCLNGKWRVHARSRPRKAFLVIGTALFDPNSTEHYLLCYLPSPVVKCQTRLRVQPSVIYTPFSSFTLFSSGLKSSECEGKDQLFLHSAISPQSASGPDAFVETRTFSFNHPRSGRCRLSLPAFCLRRCFYRKCEPVCDWSVHGDLLLLANQRRSGISGSAKEILFSRRRLFLFVKADFFTFYFIDF